MFRANPAVCLPKSLPPHIAANAKVPRKIISGPSTHPRYQGPDIPCGESELRRKMRGTGRTWPWAGPVSISYYNRLHH